MSEGLGVCEHHGDNEEILTFHIVNDQKFEVLILNFIKQLSILNVNYFRRRLHVFVL